MAMRYKLNKCLRSYSVSEKECLAAILCIKKFWAYVEGHHASLKKTCSAGLETAIITEMVPRM